MPARFQGRYAASAPACDSPGDPSRLTIGRDTLQFHESTGPVIAVAGDGPEATITASLTGEGDTWDAVYRFRLSDDGRTLTDVDNGLARVRCG